MRIIVLRNVGSGEGVATGEVPDERIAAAFRERGTAAEVRAVPGANLVAEARRAADEGADVLVAAGGDGTVSALAGVLAGTGRPLGILPLGTWNHFAKDLGLPLDLDGAVRAVVHGTPRAVDVGEVNGRVFVNNSSIGIYPLAVREREVVRRRLPKWLAMAWALVRMVALLPRLPLRLAFAGVSVLRRTPIVFVGNNAYDMRLLAPQRRARLDAGALQVLVVPRASRLALLALALRALVGRLDARRHLEALTLAEVRILARRRRLSVATDGEVVRMETPLAFRIRPGALHVVVPETP